MLTFCWIQLDRQSDINFYRVVLHANQDDDDDDNDVDDDDDSDVCLHFSLTTCVTWLHRCRLRGVPIGREWRK